MVQWSVRNRPDGTVICQEQASWCSALSGTGLMVQWSVRNRPDGAVICQEQAWWYSDLSGTGLMVQCTVRDRPDGAVLCQEQAWWCSALSGTGLMVQCSVRNRPDGAALSSAHGVEQTCKNLGQFYSKCEPVLEKKLMAAAACYPLLTVPGRQSHSAVGELWRVQQMLYNLSKFLLCTFYQSLSPEQVSAVYFLSVFITSASFCCVLSISLYNLSKFLLCTFYQSL